MKVVQYKNFIFIHNALHVKYIEHGYLYGDSDWQVYDATAPFNRMYFVTKGQAFLQSVKCPEDKIVLTEGNVYLIPVNSPYHHIGEQSFEKFYIHFRTECVPGRDIFDNANFANLPMPSEDMLRIVKLAQADDFADTFMFQAEIFQLLSRFANGLTIDHEKILLYQRYQDVFELVERNCHMETDLLFIADQLKHNVNTLRKRFREDLGLTVRQYVSGRVIEKAKEMLTETRMSLKEVAYELRFKDEFYFSRFFKKHVGCPPRQYRVNNAVAVKDYYWTYSSDPPALPRISGTHVVPDETNPALEFD